MCSDISREKLNLKSQKSNFSKTVNFHWMIVFIVRKIEPFNANATIPDTAYTIDKSIYICRCD